jgi:hypothetical protein
MFSYCYLYLVLSHICAHDMTTCPPCKTCILVCEFEDCLGQGGVSLEVPKFQSRCSCWLFKFSSEVLLHLRLGTQQVCWHALPLSLFCPGWRTKEFSLSIQYSCSQHQVLSVHSIYSFLCSTFTKPDIELLWSRRTGGSSSFSLKASVNCLPV